MKRVVGILDRHAHIHEQNLVVGSIEKVIQSLTSHGSARLDGAGSRQGLSHGDQGLHEASRQCIGRRRRKCN